MLVLWTIIGDMELQTGSPARIRAWIGITGRPSTIFRMHTKVCPRRRGREGREGREGRLCDTVFSLDLHGLVVGDPLGQFWLWMMDSMIEMAVVDVAS